MLRWCRQLFVVLELGVFSCPSRTEDACASPMADAQQLALEELQTLLATFGATVSVQDPFGLEIVGLDLAALLRTRELHHRSPLALALESAMAHQGVLVFRGQGGGRGHLRPQEQIDISAAFGAGEMHSTHGEHPLAGSEHIFRLSSSDAEGIVGPGADWHNDGAFTTEVFSHAGYHIIEIPPHGAGSQCRLSNLARPAPRPRCPPWRGQLSLTRRARAPPRRRSTSFAHLGRAYSLLAPRERRLLARMVSVNSNGGAVHPLVHTHPLSSAPTLFLHLAMTGAVGHVPEGKAGEWSLLDQA